uniref:Uncharacterized protein n=1 Tax=Astyanax mexicanus TaxID=7994 RepID=A0A3B1IPY4_ASTMX
MTDVRPCSRYLDAIRDFPRPRNVTDVRSWFGLVNQVAYAFSMAERMQPFRRLLQNGVRFEWSSELEEVFRESKETIVREIERGVRIFDKSKPTCLATDWSKEGVGFWLFQKHCRCMPVKFTHAAESRYAPIEGEALAVRPHTPVALAQVAPLAPSPASTAPEAAPPSSPDLPPATGPRRSTRSPGTPAWHKDYVMG